MTEGPARSCRQSGLIQCEICGLANPVIKKRADPLISWLKTCRLAGWWWKMCGFVNLVTEHLVTETRVDSPRQWLRAMKCSILSHAGWPYRRCWRFKTDIRLSLYPGNRRACCEAVKEWAEILKGLYARIWQPFAWLTGGISIWTWDEMEEGRLLSRWLI